MQLLAVIELFPTRMLGAFCVAFGVACVAVAVGCILSEQLQRWASGLMAKFLALSPLNKAVLVLALAVSTVCAQKSGTNEVERLGGGGQPNQESNLFCSPSTSCFDYYTQTVTPADIARGWQVWEVRTNETGFAMPANAVRNEDWFRFGGHSMFDFVGFGEGWTFPYGTQELARVTAMEDGGLRVKLSRTEDEIRAVPCPLAALPHQSQFGHTTNGQNRVFAWQGFFSGGDTGAVISASVELRANGDFVTRSNAVETLCRRIEPFDYDGDGIPNDKDARPCFYDGDHYGQSEVWVRANFTNAEEILSVGYRQWVDAQVGVGLANGLYKLTATFPEVPRRTTLLTVGDLSVCVTNAGEYVFLLEKGVEYEFGTVPYDGSVEYSMQDDVAPSAPVFAAWWWGGDARGEWTVDGGWHVLNLPTMRGFGFVMWEPTFRGSPDLEDVGVENFPKTFTALLDSCRTNVATYHWTSPDERVNILSPFARTTEVEIDSSMDGGDLELSVEACTQGRNYYSTLWYHFPTNAGPRFSLTMPDTVFVNNDDDNDDGVLDCDRRFASEITNRDDDVAFAKVGLPPGESRRGTLALYDKDGFDGTVYDAMIKGDYVGLGSEWEMTTSSPGSLSLEVSGILPSDGYRSSRIEFRWTPDDGDEQMLCHRFTVVEPVVAPICSERKSVMRDGVKHRLVYNPSGVVIGKDAYFKISVTPDDYPDSKIRWQAVGDGSVEFVGGNTGREVCVRGISEGDVTLEISIGDSPSSKPTFSARVVENVSVKMDVCILSGGGHLMREEPEVRSMLAEVNDIYEQVGITFYIDSIVVTNISHACFPVYDGLASEDHWSFDDVAHILPDAGGLKCYFIDSFVDSDDTRAANDVNGMLITREANEVSWAHEIGHACGLDDVYDEHNGVSVPADETFEWRHAIDDWNNGSVGEHTKGSRYYHKNLKRCELLKSLLMYGYGSSTKADISTGYVDGIVNIGSDMSRPGPARTGHFATGGIHPPSHQRKHNNGVQQ